MKKSLSPASIISIIGALLTVVGLLSYFTNAANLSVPTFFYGVPILLIGLALKNSELPPATNISTSSQSIKLKSDGPIELENLINDVTRYRYGQKAHLESSLKVLKLWNDENPPQLQEIKIINNDLSLGVMMKFEIFGVPIDKWYEKKDRLGRFFVKNFEANMTSPTQGFLELELLPIQLKNNNLDKETNS